MMVTFNLIVLDYLHDDDESHNALDCVHNVDESHNVLDCAHNVDESHNVLDCAHDDDDESHNEGGGGVDDGGGDGGDGDDYDDGGGGGDDDDHGEFTEGRPNPFELHCYLADHHTHQLERLKRWWQLNLPRPAVQWPPITEIMTMGQFHSLFDFISALFSATAFKVLS
jgi:hypothetical protein